MKVEEIHTYPVKSLRGIRLDSAECTSMGIRYDRNFVITDKDGQFLSQRSIPAMAKVSTSIDERSLTLSAGTGSIKIDISTSEDAFADVTVWDDKVKAYGFPKEINAWISSVLDREAYLYRVKEKRFVDSKYAAQPVPFAFSDSAPVLVTTTASLAQLNEMLIDPIGITRFRSNIVLRNDIPFEEDNMEELLIGDVRLKKVKPCGRCIVINTDQETGERYAEPLQTLAGFRKAENKVIFGMYFYPLTTGMINTGQEVIVRRSQLTA